MAEETKPITAATAEPGKQTAPQEAGPVIYVGPGFKNSRLNHCMIFRNGIPEAEGKNPILRPLFVPPERLHQALQDIKTKGTALQHFYAKAVLQHKEGK